MLAMAVRRGARRHRASTTSASTRSSSRSSPTRASPGAGLGLTLHNDICLPYFLEYCYAEQRERWLPGIADGTLITAIAMTEPGIGSDLASMSTTRDPRQRPLRRQRRQDLHHERHQRRPRDHRGQDRPVENAPRDVAADRRARHGRLRARPQPRQGRHALPGHRRAVLQRRRGAGREPARRGGQGLHLPGLQPAAGAAVDRRLRGRRAQAALDWTLEYVKERTGVRPADRQLPEHRASRSPR